MYGLSLKGPHPSQWGYQSGRHRIQAAIPPQSGPHFRRNGALPFQRGYKLNQDSGSLPPLCRPILERNATRGSEHEEVKGWPRALEAIISSMLTSSNEEVKMYTCLGQIGIGVIKNSFGHFGPISGWVFVRQSALVPPTSLRPNSVWLCMKNS